MQHRPIPPMELKIWFRKSRQKTGGPATGQLCVELKAGGQSFGPRSLPITALRKWWNPQRGQFSGPEAERLNAELDFHRSELRTAKSIVEAGVRTGQAAGGFVLPAVWQTYQRMQETGSAALPLPPPPPTVDAIWAGYEKEMVERLSAGTVAEKTLVARRKQWNRWMDFCGEAMPITELTPAVLHAYRHWFRVQKTTDNSPYSVNYINHCLTLVKSLSLRAHRLGHTATYLLSGEKLAWQQPDDPETLTDEQIQRLRALRVELRETGRVALYRAISAFLFGLETGTHFTDYWHTTADDLKTDEKGTLYIQRRREKTDQQYRVYLSDYAATLLKDFGGVAGLPRIGRNYDSALPMINRYLKDIQKLAEIPFNLCYSTGRDTFYTRLEERGAKTKTLLVSMGWATLDNRRHYSGKSAELVKKEQLG